jgi:hypothetical protein
MTITETEFEYPTPSDTKDYEENFKHNKCEMCDVELTEENTAENSDKNRCIECYEEWSDRWADQ